MSWQGDDPARLVRMRIDVVHSAVPRYPALALEPRRNLLPIELKCGPVHVALRFVCKYMRKRGRLQTETPKIIVANGPYFDR
jgi:hypothetical protein